jgi:hypothetical protein
LPAAIEAGPSEVPEVPADVAVEPLAMQVPADWFYVRFGTFANFLWFQDTLNRWSGDVRNLLATRAIDYGSRERIETRLALQMTVLSRLFGEKVVTDVAVVGTDLFLQDGGAYGLLFQARSTQLLGINLFQTRRDRAAKIPGTTEKQVTIEGRDVSFLSSPDGRIRSFYVSEGDYHFVCTSEALVRRFLTRTQGPGVLGKAKEFRYARSLLPTTRNDAVFVYFSSPFLEGYVAPRYRIEMVRRLKAEADIELVEMALLAAATEKSRAESIEQLVAEGFLPRGFGARADGSRPVIEGGNVRDSLRGWRRSFVPIPDVEVKAISAEEAESYRRFAEFSRARWQGLSPIVAAVAREAAGEDRERVSVDLRMTPLDKGQYARLTQFIGPADLKRLAPIPGDAVALELLLPGQRLFAGIQAVGPAMEIVRGELLPLGRLRNLLIGYIGTNGDPGILNLFRRRVATVTVEGPRAPDAGLLERRADQFTILSFQPEILDLVASHLKFEDAPRAAQVRFRIADLAETKVAEFANTWGYYRSRETAMGNLRLVHQVIEQFHVPPEKALDAAELLLAARLVCPLGGQYVYRKSPDGTGHYTSTEIERAAGSFLQPQVPPGFVAPPLNWLRRMDVDALLEPKALSLHAEVLMQNATKKETVKKPDR